MLRVGRSLALAAVAMTLGCAKFPANPNSQYTRLTFTITMNQPIPSLASLTDPIPSGSLYQYYVVMALYQGAGQPSPTPQQSIAPVITSGGQTGNSVNGIFTGPATNVVFYNLGAGGNPDQIYNLQSAPTVDWGNYPIQGYLAGYTSDQLPALDSNNNYPATWQFNVYMNQLQPTNPQTYTYITFQVISTNAPSTQSGRYMDALGNSPIGSFDETVPVPISTSTTYQFSQLQTVPQVVGTFPSGGDPALAIQSVTLQVSVP